jgi:hypothetical protein
MVSETLLIPHPIRLQIRHPTRHLTRVSEKLFNALMLHAKQSLIRHPWQVSEKEHPTLSEMLPETRHP